METTQRHSHAFIAALLSCALMLTILFGTLSPSIADTAGRTSTRNIALGALALAVGIVLYNNYEHEVAQANSVVGYTRDGGFLYGDGRIVYPNNITAYATNNGTQVCTFNGVGVPCRPANLHGYFRRGYKPPCWPPGHCKEYWKHHHGNDKGDKGDQGDQH